MAPPRYLLLTLSVPIKTQKRIRTAFAVYEQFPAVPRTVPVRAPPPDPLPALHAAQMARMDPGGRRTALFDKANQYRAHVGDVLLVTHRRGGEPFAGVLMSVRRAGIDTAILLRNTLTKVGVEMWYKVYNKNVAGIEVVKRRDRRARRARLTYLRKPEHDPGPQDQYVYAWKASRNVLTSRKKAKAVEKEAKKTLSR